MTWNLRKSYGTIIFLTLVAAGSSILLKEPRTIKEEYADILSKDSKQYREIRKNGYVIGVNYLPVRFFELRNLLTLDDSASYEQRQSAITTAHELYKNGIYFMITIAFENASKDIMNQDIGNFEVWSKNLQKFHFRLGDFIHLKTKQEDEIKLSVYDFQNTFGYTKDRKILLCFPKVFNDLPVLSDESRYVRMVIKDWGWGIGKQTVEWGLDELL